MNKNLFFMILTILLLSVAILFYNLSLYNKSKKQEPTTQYTIDETAYNGAKYIKVTIDIVKETEVLENE